MSGPLEFAARFLARRGALVEASAGVAEALLPRELAAELGLGEHALLGERPDPPARHVGYGSALLERMVASAAKTIPFAAARVDAAPARGSQARAAGEALVFRNGVFSVGQPLAAVGHRLLLHAAFAFHGDERREGLCATASSLATQGVVEGFPEAIAGALEEAVVEPLEPLDPAGLAASARAALGACSVHASAAAEGFREATQRRYARDRERLEGYFADLVSELDRRAVRGRAHRGDVDEKRRVLERERAAKLEALSARYAMKLELRPVALVLVEAPVYRIPLELRRRKAVRSIELEFDCVTRRLVAPVCDACGSAAPRPAACDEAVHLLCEGCAPRSEGRVECAACRVRRGGSAHRRTTGQAIEAGASCARGQPLAQSP